MKLVIASDHAGFALKQSLFRFLTNSGHEVRDMGTTSEASMDYPDTIAPAARAVAAGEAERGVVICGSGIGASITANKIKGIRAALCSDMYDAEYSRRHNDANIIALGARKMTEDKAMEILVKWLSTPFEGGRHQERLDKIRALEEA